MACMAQLLVLATFVLAAAEEKAAAHCSLSHICSRHPPVFRVGSGAEVLNEPMMLRRSQDRTVEGPYPHNERDYTSTAITSAVLNERPFLAAHVLPGPVPVQKRLVRVFTMINPLIIVGIVLLMMPRMSTGSREFNYRVPPEWSPENEQTYSYRAYMTDLSIWCLLTDLQPHQQAAAIVSRLGGTAREYARMLNPNELMFGGVQNGVHVDPVTYILAGLHSRFSPLEEESRLTAMTEFMAFARKPGEPINSVLSRYETVRQRAAMEGQFTMPIEGCSLQLFRALGVGAQQLMTLLQPFNGQLPRNQQQFNEMCQNLRRYGHITEHYPGNIAQSLHGPFRQARPGAYHVAEDDPLGAARDAAQRTTTDGMHAFFGNARNQQSAPNARWDSQQPLLYDHTSNPPAIWDAALGQGASSSGGYWGGDRAVETDQWPDAYETHAFPVDEEESLSSSATSSDSGDEDIDMPDVSHMTDAEAAEFLYYQHRKAKRVWRRFTGRPVRTFRRRLKRFGKGKGKGKRKGKNRGFMFTRDDVEAFISKGKGGGKRSHTSGKGLGRRKNPKDRNGNTMRCRICDSDEHFAARCPQNTGGKGKGSGKFGRGSPSSPMLFSGMAQEPPAPSGDRRVEGGEAPPPWQDQDLFEVTDEVFMAAQHDGADPLVADDPWTRGRSQAASSWGYDASRRRPSSPRHAADPMGWYRPDSGVPAYAQRPAAKAMPAQPVPRVDQTDELSQSEDEAASPAAPAAAAAGPAATAPTWPPTTYAAPPGYTTPPIPGSWVPQGIFNTWQHRTDGTPISDSILQRVYQVQQMSDATRTRQPIRNLHLHRHQFPISVASSNSAQLTPHVVTPGRMAMIH